MRQKWVSSKTMSWGGSTRMEEIIAKGPKGKHTNKGLDPNNPCPGGHAFGPLENTEMPPDHIIPIVL